MNEPLVINVDENDNVLGYVPKLEAHQKGILHRAISILIFNEKGDWMLQKRADSKYHSPSLWTNTCCSHPYPNEDTEEAAVRRLKEEMGIECGLVEIFEFTYRTEFDNGLIEHELDHVFFGIYNEAPSPNPKEASDWKFVSKSTLELDMSENSSKYTEWFKLIVPRVVHNFDHYKQKLNRK